ncbi:MAG: S58 family peptidase, partial [Serratia marcescens]|nr:S58 family peptidase [Serratia marcescens]
MGPGYFFCPLRFSIYGAAHCAIFWFSDGLTADEGTMTDSQVFEQQSLDNLLSYWRRHRRLPGAR